MDEENNNDLAKSQKKTISRHVTNHYHCI